jgi:hypothetical protein
MMGYATTLRYWITLYSSAKLAFKPGSKSRSRDGYVHNAAHQWFGTLVSAISEERSNPIACRHYRTIKNNAVKGDENLRMRFNIVKVWWRHCYYIHYG